MRDGMLSETERALQAALREDELIALLAALVQSPSCSGEEAPAVERLAAWLDEHGLAPRLEEAAPGRPNLHCQIGSGGGPVLLLTGHSDTVPIGEGWTRDPFGAEIEGGRLYGRGACDMKAGLAGMAVAMTILKDAMNSPGRGSLGAGTVIFAACVDEEVSGIGTCAAIRAGLKADGAVIGEPTDLQPIRACKGNCYFEVEVTGRAAHAGAPHLGANAIYGAMEAIRASRIHNAEIAHHRHNLLGSPSLSVGTIQGGFTVSAVPDKCSFWVDRRLLPQETGAGALAAYSDSLRRHGEAVEGTHRSEWLRMELPPSEVQEDHPMVRALVRAAAASGVSPQPVGGWSAASDGGYLMRDAGIPTVLFGPGSITNQAHRPDEYVPIEEVILAARTYLTLAARALAGETDILPARS